MKTSRYVRPLRVELKAFGLRLTAYGREIPVYGLAMIFLITVGPPLWRMSGLI